jgi:competence protein ComEC
LRALIVGDRARLVDSARRPFERSGTAHLLAVSGLHIGWAFALGRLLVLGGLYPWPGVRLQRGRRRWAAFFGLGVGASYAILAGLSVPTLRAAAMAGAGAVTLLGGRPAAGWNALAGAALFILALDPASLFAPSFGLSFLAVAGILLWRPRGRLVTQLASCTLGASLATAPLLVHLGLPLPTLGIVANLVLVPWFTGVVVPLGLGVAVLALVLPEGAALLAPLARVAADAGLRAAELLASPELLPASATSAPVAAIVGAVFAVRVGLRGELRLAGAIGLLAGMVGVTTGITASRSPAHPGLEVLFLDVGHGDATVVRHADSAWLVDAGPRWGSFDAGRRVVLPALRAEAVGRLDVLVLTHADRDHIGGASAVVERFDVGEIWVSPLTVDDPSLRRVREAAATRGVPLRIVVSGYEARLGEWRARALWPPPGLRPSSRNDGGLVVRLEGPAGCAILPADASLAVEQELAAGVSRCALLKLGHHGSETSSGPLWLAELDPDIAIASASCYRAGQFPSPAVRDRLRARHVTLYETARFGAVRVRLTDRPVVLPYRTDALADPPMR